MQSKSGLHMHIRVEAALRMLIGRCYKQSAQLSGRNPYARISA